MTIFEPTAHPLEQPHIEQCGLECCRFYVTEVTEVDGRLVVTGVDLDTFKFRSFVGGVVTKAVDDFRLANTQNVWIIRPNRVSNGGTLSG